MLRYASKLVATSLFLLGGAYVGSVTANNLKIPDFYSEPGLNKGRAYENGLGNEAIDPFSGGLLLQYQDLVLPGNGGLDIVVNRTYRSLQGAEPILEQRQERRVAGIGWDIHFGRVWTAPDTVLCDTLGTVTTGPNLPASNRNPTFEASDGSRKVLVTEFSGTTPYHMISKGRWIATCLPAADNPWSNLDGLVVQSPDGMKYTFGVRGRAEIGNQANNLPLLVNSIEDRNGNWLVIDYDYTTSYALIDRVRASDGREVRFYYTKGALQEDVRLDRITAYPGTPEERTWRYTYTPAQFTSTAFTSPWYLLTQVDSPESDVVWRYSYYPDDPDGPDAATGKYDPARFSLKTINLPEGAAIDYEYAGVAFDTRPGALGTDIVTTVVSRKIQRGQDIENGTWNYEYRPYSVAPGALDALIPDISFPTLDETLVKGPQFCTTYKHVGIKSISFNANDNLDDGVWTVGLLLERKQYAGPSCSGTVLEQQTIKWGKQLVSEQNDFRPSRSAIDENTYAPIMLEKTIQRDGTSYTTTFGDYDVYGNPQTVIEQGQDTKTTTFVYQPNTAKWLLKLVQSETIQGIGTTTRTFDGNGNPLTETRYGVRTSFSYHPTGDVAAIQDARGFVKRFNNYFRGIPQNEVQPEGVTINRVVSEAGTVQSETNGRGRTTRYTYDKLNRITSITRPRGALTTIARPSANEKILSRGAFRKRELLDGLGRVITSISEDTVSGYRVQKTIRYDNINRKVFESYPNSTLGTTTAYDALGRVLMRSQPDGVVTRFSYLGGNQVQLTDPRGNVTRMFYRSYGSPDQRSLLRMESPESVVTTITRNQIDLVTSIQQGDFQRGFVYDSRYYLIQESHPEVGTIRFSRDALGNKISETYGSGTSARTSSYRYDGLNRLTSVLYGGGSPDILYDYDLNNNLVSLSRGDTSWTYSYDDNDNLIKESLLVAGQQFELGYQYDALDALSQTTYPSGLTVAYAPNSFGWPSQVGGFVTSVSYHPSGHVRSIQYANGVQQTVQLNARLLPSSITASGIVELGYQYDQAGNVISITDSIDPAKDIAMTYDGINRLTSANGLWGSGVFGYDGVGNLNSRSIGATSQTYSYNATTNRLDSITAGGVFTLAYDVFGNVISDGTHAYVYDDASDLTQVVSGSRFRYDGHKRRAVEETPDTTIYTLYSQAGQLMYEYDYSNMIKKEYIRLGVNLVAVREDICDAGSTDTDGDGIPDCFEERVGLDPAKAADGAVDADGDGLTNLQEFQLKTDLFGADTDMDGIPDGFEVQNGLDPLKADAQADRDGDGYSNLQEYAGRSDLNDPTSIPNAAPRWSATLPGVASFPAIATDGTIYVLASDVATMTLHAFANDGTKLWARDLPVMAGGCQSLVDDTGEGPGLAGQVAVDRQGGIYASCDGGGTYQLDSAGNVIWSYPSGGFLAVTDDRVHIATVFTTNAEVHVLDTSGAPVWTYTNAAAPFGDSIVVGADGILYAVTGCNGWRAFECTGSGGSVDVYAIAKNGVLKWVRRDIGVVYGKPAIGFDGTLYIGARAPGVGESRLVALNPDGTFQRKSSQIRLDFEVGTSSGHSAPVLDKQGNVLSSIVFPGVYSPALQQINMVSVAPPPDESRAHSLLLAGMGRAYLSANGVIHAVDVSGASIWSSGILNDPNIGNLNIDPNGSFVVTSVGASTSTLYSATNNDGRIIEDSVWPIRGANPRQTRAIENCAGQDQDGDGLPDCYERWIGGDETDPGNAALDPDGDGLTNLDEYTAGTHPYLADSDGDLMPDGYERGRGLDPRSNGTLEDSDGDGAIDSIEFRLGTDPSDPSSVPQFGAQIWSLSADSAVTAAPVSEALGEPLFPGIGLVNHLGEVQFGWLGGALSVTPLVTGANRIIGSRNPPYQNLFAMPWVQPQLGMNHFWQTSAGGLIGPGFGLGANDVVYFGASPNTLYAIDSSGWSAVFSDHLIWSQTFAADVSTLPVVLSSGVVVVGTADGVVHALDGSGTELWSFAAMGAIRGSAAAGADDTIYVGSDDGRLYALRPDGTLAWSFTVGAVISTSPVIGGDGTVYVAAEDGFLYAVDATGVMRWSFQTGGAIRANPLIGSDNALYFGSDDGYVYAVQPDGSQAWRASTGVPVGDSSPYIDDKGVLYVGVSDNRLLGLYAGVKGLADTPWPTLGHDVHRTGNVSTRLAQPDQPPALTIVTPTAGQTVSVGDTVVFTAAAPDPEDGDLANAVSWSSSLDGPLGTGSPLNVSTLSVGTHVVTATVSDSGGNSVAVVVTLSVQQAAVVATLSTDVDSPQTVGALVTVSAVVSDTTTSYDYRFRVKGDATGDAWVLLSDYSAQSSVAWDTTAYPGRNRLQVSVRQTGTTGAVIRSGKTYWVNGVDAAQSVTLTSDKASPQTVGQVVRLSGAASGGSGPYEYRFEVRSVTSNGSWQLLQDYSSQAWVDWATNGYLGKNRVRVLARKAGSPDKPVREGRAYWINAPNAATGVDLTLTPDGTQASGTAIQLSAQGQGGSGNYVYEFQLKGPSTGDRWQVLQAFGATPSYTWDSSGALGQHRLRVRAKNAGTDDKPVNRGRNLILQ